MLEVLKIDEALPVVLGNRGKWYLFQGDRGTKAKVGGEQGNKDNIEGT